jgi:hypothetical protein
MKLKIWSDFVCVLAVLENDLVIAEALDLLEMKVLMMNWQTMLHLLTVMKPSSN